MLGRGARHKQAGDFSFFLFHGIDRVRAQIHERDEAFPGQAADAEQIGRAADRERGIDEGARRDEISAVIRWDLGRAARAALPHRRRVPFRIDVGDEAHIGLPSRLSTLSQWRLTR
ncbi:MAG: hypothetical protein WDM79_01195 [Terricaulis sp.]